MVPYLVSAVMLACALGALNLLLTLAVIRRLREHSELLASRPAGNEPGVIEPGQTPGEFTATDTDGRPLRREKLTGDVLVAFFSQGCRACTDALPRFVTWAAAFPGGRGQVLAVMSGELPWASELAATLAGVARVVIEDSEGDLATAFQVRAFPCWCLLDATGTVSRSGGGWTDLPTPGPT
jgi:hypothetical protein